MAISRRLPLYSMTWLPEREHSSGTMAHRGAAVASGPCRLTFRQWEELIHQARRANLLS
jgi:hypothetical protein